MNDTISALKSAFDPIVKDLGNSAYLFEKLWTAPKAALISWLLQRGIKRIVLISDTARSQGVLQQELPFFTKIPVHVFPPLDEEAVGQEPDLALVGQRMKTLSACINEDSQILLTDLAALQRPTFSPTALYLKRLHLKKGEQLSPLDLTEKLLAMGFEKTHLAVEKGQFAPRSGLIDILPSGEVMGYRIDFWGDEIESIRTFDPGSQRSHQSVNELEILPAREMMNSDERGTLLDYIDEWEAAPAIILDDLAALEHRQIELYGALQRQKFDQGLGKLIRGLGPKFYLINAPLPELSETTLIEPPTATRRAPKLNFSFFGSSLSALCPFSPFQRWQARFGHLAHAETKDALIQAIGQASDEDFTVIVASSNEADRAFAVQKLQKRGLDPTICKFVDGYLSEGFVLEGAKIALASTVQLTGHITLHRPQVTSGYRDPLEDDSQLELGGLVVHQQNGVGLFRGVEQRQNHLGETAEFLKIEYADRAQLYVPLQQAHMIDKYISTKEEAPRLHTLGSSRWKTLRLQTEEAIGGYAESLLKMDAERALKRGFGYRQDSVEVKRFEAAFPYALTEDQEKAVAAIKADLASTKLMDRLVCGDVGYGKTEVAMRAAFKTAVDGKQQVVLLVPTTVLALQHFETFSERMSSFDLNIAQLSRFTSAKEGRQTLKSLADGKIDILIGTHRVLSRDIEFHNLGMVIIDEEQRFGVRAKEHLRSFRAKAHCLTLSATPIPRTLYLSLMGTRELSVINTPPRDRQHVATIIAPASDELIAAALTKELHRQGQIFVIHNRVESLPVWKERLQRLLPQARIAVAHGQMDAESIDAVFHAFKSGTADILLATSIVENGIDIPNANTLIVDRSDSFGLSDLHQLRGRVGRWNRKAFAYFLYPPNRVLPEVSAKRLRALQETSGPAGGMKIAMRDLQIRGCGQILGQQQSGHVSSVGFHLYCKLLKRTLETMRGQRPPSLGDVRVELPFEGRISADYVDDVTLRMHLYRRLGDCESIDEVDALKDELIDRFGRPPLGLQWLLVTARLRCFAAESQIKSVKLTPLANVKKIKGLLEQGHLQMERKNERKTTIHRAQISLNPNPQELEKAVRSEIEALNLLEQTLREKQVAKTLKKRSPLTKLQNAASHQAS